MQVFDVGSGTRLFELQRKVGGSEAVVFSRDGGRIATADSDTVVRIYDGRNGELLSRHTDFLLQPLAALFTVDGKQLLAAGSDEVITVVDASTGSVVRKRTQNLFCMLPGLLAVRVGLGSPRFLARQNRCVDSPSPGSRSAAERSSSTGSWPSGRDYWGRREPPTPGRTCRSSGAATESTMASPTD